MQDQSQTLGRSSSLNKLKKVKSDFGKLIKRSSTGNRHNRRGTKRESETYEESSDLRISNSSLSITLPESDIEEGIYILSLDVICLIMNYMSMRELGVISQVCKYWRSFCIQLLEGKCFPCSNTAGRRIRLSKSLSWSDLTISTEPEDKDYKIVVLGSGASGKSCLIRRLLQNTYVEKYDPTIEDTYSKELMVDGQTCQLTIVDTGVGEYQALTDGYIVTAEGVMILYAINSRSSFDYASKMRRRILELKRKSNRPPIILIGTKLDLETDRTVTRDEGQKMANAWNPEYFHNYFELTSKEAQPTILESFSEMVRQIEDTRQMKKNPNQDEGKKCSIM